MFEDQIETIRQHIVDAAKEAELYESNAKHVISEASALSELNRELSDALDGDMRDLINLGLETHQWRAVIHLDPRSHWSTPATTRSKLKEAIGSQGVSYQVMELPCYAALVVIFDEEHDYTMGNLILDGQIKTIHWNGTI